MTGNQGWRGVWLRVLEVTKDFLNKVKPGLGLPRRRPGARPASGWLVATSKPAGEALAQRTPSADPMVSWVPTLVSVHGHWSHS